MLVTSKPAALSFSAAVPAAPTTPLPLRTDRVTVTGVEGTGVEVTVTGLVPTGVFGEVAGQKIMMQATAIINNVTPRAIKISRVGFVVSTTGSIIDMLHSNYYFVQDLRVEKKNRITNPEIGIRLSLALTLLAIAAFNTVPDTPQNCATAPEPNEQIAVVVLGSGAHRRDGRKVPDDTMDMRLLAATKFYQQHREHITTIMVLDGSPDPDEPNYIHKRLQEIDSSIPPEIIDSSHKSIITATDIEIAGKLIPKDKKVIFLTNKIHLARAILFACGKKIKAFGIAIEDILNTKPTFDWWVPASETLQRSIWIFDPNGQIPLFLRKNIVK